MIASRPLPGFLAALFAAGSVTFVSTGAHAGTCTTDADCSKGLACQVVGSTECSNMACPAGADCPMLPPCDPTPIKACVPGPCSVDADCGDGMVCYENPSKSCSVPPREACAPGQMCDAAPPPQPSCTTTEKICVPRYLLPCTAASDCGAGFNCVLDTSACACASGSMGSSGTEPAPTPLPDPAPSGSSVPPSMPAPMDAGAAPMPECPPCPPATTSHCEPQVVDCAATSDCPSGWLCTEVGGSGSTCGAAILPDGGIGMTVCDPTPPTIIKQCTPPYYEAIVHANDVGVFNNSSSGSGTIGLPQLGSETGAAGASGTPSAPKSSNAAGSGAAASGDQGGCQIGHGSSSSGTSLLALVGLVGLARRKRTTRREG